MMTRPGALVPAGVDGGCPAACVAACVGLVLLVPDCTGVHAATEDATAAIAAACAAEGRGGGGPGMLRLEIGSCAGHRGLDAHPLTALLSASASPMNCPALAVVLALPEAAGGAPAQGTYTQRMLSRLNTHGCVAALSHMHVTGSTQFPTHTKRSKRPE